MRILNISSLYPPNVVGGAEQGLQTISNAMVQLGHEVHVVTLRSPGQEAQANSQGVEVHRVTLANRYWPFDKQRHERKAWEKAAWHLRDTSNKTMARRARAIVARVQPDIVLTRNLQGFSTAVMPAIKSLDLPLAHVLHDYALICPQTTLYRNGRACGLRDRRCGECRVLSWPRAKHARSVDFVIGVSHSVLGFHHDHGLFLQTPSAVVYNALKPSMIESSGPRPTPRDRSLVFGFIGRIEKFKGVETLLHAAQQLAKQGVTAEFRLAGRGEEAYINALRARFPEVDLTFPGFVNNVEFYRAVDVLVYPSEWLEALGNGVFEAYSQGLPVIGSNIGGIPETISHEVDGLVFEAGNVSQLAAQMRRIVDGDINYAGLSAAAVEKSRQYAPAKRASEYIEVLQTFLGEYRGYR